MWARRSVLAAGSALAMFGCFGGGWALFTSAQPPPPPSSAPLLNILTTGTAPIAVDIRVDYPRNIVVTVSFPGGSPPSALLEVVSGGAVVRSDGSFADVDAYVGPTGNALFEVRPDDPIVRRSPSETHVISPAVVSAVSGSDRVIERAERMTGVTGWTTATGTVRVQLQQLQGDISYASPAPDEDLAWTGKIDANGAGRFPAKSARARLTIPQGVRKAQNYALLAGVLFGLGGNAAIACVGLWVRSRWDRAVPTSSL